MKLNKMREEMANKFIEGLKQDDIPWQRNWSTLGTRPVNATKGTAYHGVNSFWLSTVAEEKGYKDPRWCTFNQAKEKGWKINRGEKGTRIEFWSLYDTVAKKKIKPEEEEKLKKSLESEEYAKRVKPIASVYSVFNAEQMTGVPEIVIDKHEWQPEEMIAKRDLLLKNMDLSFQGGEERAFYRPSEDSVHMPDPERFTDDYAYFSTFLHEAGHATGHESRLDRKISNTFGSPDYAREELRAEIASAFTAQSLGWDSSKQEYMENHKAYVQSWIKALEENPQELFSAIKDAEKISDYLIEKGELERSQMREEEKANDIDHQPDSIKHVTEEGILYYDSSIIEKEIPENMRYKEANPSLQNDGGMYWVTQEGFTMYDLEKFQDVMIKYDIPKAYVTVRDMSNSYTFEEDKENHVLVEITKDSIDCRAFNKTCKELDINWACIYPEVQENDKALQDLTVLGFYTKDHAQYIHYKDNEHEYLTNGVCDWGYPDQTDKWVKEHVTGLTKVDKLPDEAKFLEDLKENHPGMKLTNYMSKIVPHTDLDKDYKYETEPDPYCSTQDMHDYGYTDDDMLPMNSKVAKELVKDPDCPTIYALNRDDTERELGIMAYLRDDIPQVGEIIVNDYIETGVEMFGVGKKDWSDYQMKDTDWLDTPRGSIKILPGASKESLIDKGYSSWFNHENYAILIDGNGKRAFAVDKDGEMTEKRLDLTKDKNQNYDLIFGDHRSEKQKQKDKETQELIFGKGSKSAERDMGKEKTLSMEMER